MTTTTTQADGFIATDTDAFLIYGIGGTEEGAYLDAAQWADPGTAFDVIPATSRLLERIERDGGGPDIRWSVAGGIADLDA